VTAREQQAVTRHRNRLVLHFWVAQWIIASRQPFTRRELADAFQVTYPTAREWASAALRAGMAQEAGRVNGAMMLRSKT
jgi:hypothetical protein